MAVVKTYLGAVKPVGEKILLNYVRVPVTATDDAFEFVIDANYCVTGIELTKTAIALQNAANILSAVVYRVDNSGALTAIGQCAVAGTTTGALGAKQIAGVAATSVAVGLPVSGTAVTYLDPTVLVTANRAATTPLGNSRQKIQIQIQSVLGGAFPFNPSCFVEVQLAKFNSLVTQQGTVAGLNGIQTSELLNPPV